MLPHVAWLSCAIPFLLHLPVLQQLIFLLDHLVSRQYKKLPTYSLCPRSSTLLVMCLTATHALFFAMYTSTSHVYPLLSQSIYLYTNMFVLLEYEHKLPLPFKISCVLLPLQSSGSERLKYFEEAFFSTSKTHLVSTVCHSLGHLPQQHLDCL